jgi:hypothetical protein
MMKLNSLLISVGLLLAGAGAMPAWADNFRPERGVRCDDSVSICYERGEPSLEMTRRYFGRDAARRLGRDLRREERGYGGRMFFPERGVRCDRTEQICYDRRGNPSIGLTGEYLGPSAARRLGRQLSGRGYGDGWRNNRHSAPLSVIS